MKKVSASFLLNSILGVTLFTSACGKKEEPKTVPQPPAPQASAPAPAAPPVQPALATVDGQQPGSRIEVQELKRVSGGTVMLRLVMINDGEKDVDFGYTFGEGGSLKVTDLNTIGGVHLVDPVGKKKYLVVRDSQNQCDCSRDVTELTPKSRVNLWARFPSPPDNVEKITVIVPHFSPMGDVPISR